MKRDEIAKLCRSLAKPYEVTDGKRFRLADCDPGDTAHLNSEDKPRAKKALAMGVEALAELQGRLYARDSWAVLLIFQAMDAAGKDGAIKHVMSGVNPQGCQVFSFKAPTSVELDHDFLWRCARSVPERGRIGIFNRSYYEETLVVRVHPELLKVQKLPPQLVNKNIWSQRYRAIRNFERHLSENGVAICKFFLHVSKEEQKSRFLDRIDDHAKNWKFSTADAKERGHWDEYMHAYEETIRNTATEYAPWHVVPADKKWYTRLVVAATVIDTLEKLDLHYPEVSAAQKADLAAAREALLGEN